MQTAISIALYAGWKPSVWKKSRGNKTTILVADFHSLNGGNKAVSETIIEQLQHETKSYLDVRVKALGETITLKQGSEVAKNKCAENEGNILLWGWYSETDEKVSVTVYFEMLRPPEDIVFENRKRLIASRSDFESFKIQEQLSGEVTYVLLLTLGLTRFQAKDYEEAIERFTRAINQKIVPEEMISRTYAYLYRGISYDEKGQADLAIADYTKAVEINPSDAIAYYNRGLSYKNKGQFDLAITDYTKAIELKPSYAIAYNNRGISYDEKGQADLAIADYTKAIEINPSNTIAYCNRGFIYRKQGQFDLAIAECNKAIELNPSHADAYFNRGFSYYCRNEFNLAIADYSKVIKLNPSHAVAYFNRGFNYNKQGQFDLAILDYNKAIELDPSDADTYFNRGFNYNKQGQFDLAIADYTKAIEINPTYAEAHLARAEVYQLKKDKDGAISDLEQVLNLTMDQSLRQKANKILNNLKK